VISGVETINIIFQGSGVDARTDYVINYGEMINIIFRGSGLNARTA
jgi:hypothetical protein